MSTIIPKGALNSCPTREQALQAREAALIAQFPKDAYVRLQPGQAESYQAAETAKMKDRVGIIRSHQMYGGSPIVEFPPVGRKKLFRKVFSTPQHCLELLTDETEIEQWRAQFAEAETKAAAKKPKASPVNKA
jgi:hypothetical protein